MHHERATASKVIKMIIIINLNIDIFHPVSISEKITGELAWKMYKIQESLLFHKNKCDFCEKNIYSSPDYLKNLDKIRLSSINPNLGDSSNIIQNFDDTPDYESEIDQETLIDKYDHRNWSEKDFLDEQEYELKYSKNAQRLNKIEARKSKKNAKFYRVLEHLQ